LLLEKKIKDVKDGWKELTDMLRAKIICTSAAEVLKVLWSL